MFNEKTWTVEEVAAAVSKKPATILRWIREGRIPAVRLGNRYILLQSSLDAWLKKIVEEQDAKHQGWRGGNR
jgi:excisionase family DNA binding protein